MHHDIEIMITFLFVIKLNYYVKNFQSRVIIIAILIIKLFVTIFLKTKLSL